MLREIRRRDSSSRRGNAAKPPTAPLARVTRAAIAISACATLWACDRPSEEQSHDAQVLVEASGTKALVKAPVIRPVKISEAEMREIEQGDEGETEVKGIRYRKRGLVLSNGRVISGILLEKTAFGKCEYSGSIEFYRNGKVKSGTLAKGAEIQRDSFPGGTEISFNDEGRLSKAVLPSKARIADYELPAGTVIEYYPNGRPHAISLGGEAVFNGDTYRQGTLARFTKTGRLRDIVLPVDTKIQGIMFRKSTGRGIDRMVLFHKNERVASGMIAEETNIGGMRYMGDSRISLFPNGKVLFGTLAEAKTFGNESFQPGDAVRFNKYGDLVIPEDFDDHF